MSNIKERLLGAITVMSDEEAYAIWNVILSKFSNWESIEEVEADNIDKSMLKEINSNPDCTSFISSDQLKTDLGL